MQCCKRKENNSYKNSFSQNSIRGPNNSLVSLKKAIESQFKVDVIDDP